MFARMRDRFRLLVLVLVVCLHFVGLTRLSAQETAKTAKKEPEAAEVGTRFRCNDGSSAPKGRGACSRHGGVDKAAASDSPRSMTSARSGTTSGAPTTGNSPDTSTAGNPQASARGTRTTDTQHSEPMSKPSAALPGVATVRCKDGTLSAKKPESGICASHGGVEQWLDGPSK
jgi:Protein of unknown function (DUF3761)